MSIIHLLDKEISEKIAAGEVVERPLSIVKELIENSIDAKASSITVEIKKGGKEYIRVSDDGLGMNKEDAQLCFLRYATSKINSEKELFEIKSLGFRGEALASIAAVASVELFTKIKDERLGNRIFIKGGEILKAEEASCNNGSSFIVKDLFFNTPARKKFLKSDAKESASIIEFLSKIAIAYPNIHFKFINNGKLLFSTPGKGDLKKTLFTVYNQKILQNLLPVNMAEENIEISGFISSLSNTLPTRKYQIFFVNGRLIKSKILENALLEGYDRKLFDGKFPAAFLFLKLSPDFIDVNIHPAKTEIRFFDEEAIMAFVSSAIKKALLSPKAQELRAENIRTEKREDSVFFESFSEEIPKNLFLMQEDILKAEEKLLFSNLSYIGVCFSTYLLLKDESFLYLIDQHAAHERVLYEKFLNYFEKKEEGSQVLLVPIILSLSFSEKEEALENLSKLKDLGYLIEDFENNQLLVKEIPSFLNREQAENFLKEFFLGISSKISDIMQSEIIMSACKAAVKSGDNLSEKEVYALLKELENCDNPYTCPHGRPTYIRLSEKELEKLFKRI